MFSSTFSLLLATLAISAIAAPASDNISVASMTKRQVQCAFTGSVDLTLVAKAVAGCKAITFTGASFPALKTLDLSKLMTGATVTFAGHNVWLANGPWPGPLLSIGGKGITVTGAAGATLDGNGAKYWDGKGSGTGATVKPKFLAAHGMSAMSAINNLHIINTPVQVVSINNSHDLTIKDMTIDNSSGNPVGGVVTAHNTDGFDIGLSTNIMIDGARVKNQDDCVAINSGTGITFQNGVCTGGHGLSIGSVGHAATVVGNTVSNVKFLNSQVVDSDNGIRVKSFFDGTGKIDQVTFSGITLSSIKKFGILIEQSYNGGDLGPKVGTNVPLTGLTIDNITGSVQSAATHAAIVCGSTTSCSGWTWNKVSFTGGVLYKSCTSVPSVVPAGTCARS